MAKLEVMHISPVAALIASAATVGGTVVTEATSSGIASPFFVIFVNVIVTLVVSVAVLKFWMQRLDQMQETMRREMREDLREIYGLMRDTSERVATLEGVIKR
jgi:hypothetical protein